jgi:2-polyprenyl-3-methyl-5-hydroxy-6-metoxy-1,4-benzoquinol methylase
MTLAGGLEPRLLPPTRDRRCPNCGGDALPAFSTRDRNLRVSRVSFDYFGCPNCGLVFLASVPEDLDRYYPARYYQLPESRQRLAELASRERIKLDLIRPYRAAGDLLEVGPAWGSFAYAAKLAGYSVSVVEMDERCRNYLRDEVGVTVLEQANAGALPRSLGSYDVVALWHVVEHLPDFKRMLVELGGRVRPGGIVVVATPNPAAWQFRVMRGAWPHVDAPRHLQLVPASVLGEILGPLGFHTEVETTSDAGGLSWNRFGWQRRLLNALPSARLFRLAGLATGYLAGLVLGPLDNRPMQGAAYTMILRRSLDERLPASERQTGSIPRVRSEAGDA